CAQSRGDRAGAVARSVVHDKRVESARHAAENPRERLGFVEHREDDLWHGGERMAGRPSFPLRNEKPRSVAAVILVTGGAGFIGSHIVDALRADGRDVRVLDVRERGDDVRDLATVERYLDGVTAVCHQAAMVGLGVDMADITDFVAHNDLGTATLLKALAARRFRGGLVLASSMVVYGEGRYACAAHGELAAPPRVPGDLEAGRFDPRCPDCGGPLEPLAVSEDAPLRPASVYAATKVHQEHLCFAFARETGVPVTALRYHNVYGPRM